MTADNRPLDRSILGPRVERERPRQGVLAVISGPTGVGKNAISEGVLGRDKDINKIVTCTTRPIRKGIEQDGVDYKFVTKAEFDAMDLILKGERDGYDYGVCREDLARVLGGEDLLLIIDPEAALTIRETLRDSKIFNPEVGQGIERSLLVLAVMPENQADLWERFSQRAKESGGEAGARTSYEARIKKDYAVLTDGTRFPNVVFNKTGALDQTVEQIHAFIEIKRKTMPTLSGWD